MLNVVMVSGHACIRVHKMTVPLVQDGYRVHLAAKKMPPGFTNYYYSLMRCDNMSHYMDAIDVYAKTADIFHCHNEPSWFVTAVKERCEVPVILDVHDSYLGRMTDEEVAKLLPAEPDMEQTAFRHIVEERNNFQLADGLVFPGAGFADLVRSEYKLTQPYLVLPSYLPRAYYQYKGPGWLGGLVYEGRVDMPNPEGQSYGFRYADYYKLAEQARELGLDFHIYSNRQDDKFIQLYTGKAILHPPHPYHELLNSLQSHDWGLVGNVEPTPEWDIAFPNKLFEYIAAAVPVVAINAPLCASFIKEYGFGIEVQSLQELTERWGEHESVRRTLIKNRMMFTMEKHIQSLKDFYGRFVS